MLFRYHNIDTQRAQDQDGGDYVVEMAFASEVPYERWWGIEVLDCSDAAVRLGRLNDGASVLFNHNWSALRGVHVANTVRCDSDKVVRGKVRLTSATQEGRDTINLVKSGVLTKTSVGYEIHRVIEQTTAKDGRTVERELDGAVFEGVRTRAEETSRGDLAAFRRLLDERFGAFERGSDDPVVYRVVDWEPIENSLVTVPADATVGVGRSAQDMEVKSGSATPPKGISQKGVHMQVQENAPAGASAENSLSPENQRKLEQARCDSLAQLAEQNQIDAGVVRRWIGQGLTPNQATEEVLDILEKRSKDAAVLGKLDMSKKEVQGYSMLRAIGAILDQNWKNAGLELEAHKEIQSRVGRAPASNNAFFVPFDIQSRGIDVRDEDMEREIRRRVMRATGRRDLTVGTSNAGGFAVGTSNQGFIELQRNQMVLNGLGARRLGGLTDSITIPRQTSGATAYWLATEATAITESQLVLGQISLTPKTVGAYTEISRQLTLQANPDMENLVMVDLAAQTAIDGDAKGINGSGASGQPTGLLNTGGTGAVTGTSIAYAGIIEFQTDVFGGNTLMAGSAYLTTGAVAGLLKQRVKFSSTASPLWDGRLEMGNVDGYTGMASNQVPAGTLIFGDFSQMVIAEWGVLEVDVNPFANFQAGIIGVRAMMSMDVAVRYPSAFSIATSVT
jgi:HK97 family phage major capsid protein